MIDILVGCVATWRLTHLFLIENGPFRMFRKLRTKLGVEYESDDADVVISYKHEITVCPWCLSVWVGAGAAVILAIPKAGRYILLPFVFSAGSVWAGQIMEAYKTRYRKEQFSEFRVN